jgi:hypothetical protein
VNGNAPGERVQTRLFGPVQIGEQPADVPRVRESPSRPKLGNTSTGYSHRGAIAEGFCVSKEESVGLVWKTVVAVHCSAARLVSRGLDMKPQVGENGRGCLDGSRMDRPADTAGEQPEGFPGRTGLGGRRAKCGRVPQPKRQPVQGGEFPEALEFGYPGNPSDPGGAIRRAEKCGCADAESAAQGAEPGAEEEPEMGGASPMLQSSGVVHHFREPNEGRARRFARAAAKAIVQMSLKGRGIGNPLLGPALNQCDSTPG